MPKASEIRAQMKNLNLPAPVEENKATATPLIFQKQLSQQEQKEKPKFSEFIVGASSEGFWSTKGQDAILKCIEGDETSD